MNEFENIHDPADVQQLLDRLVDDELNESERRELLLRLEIEPEGWRRCALSFLEAQSFGDALCRASRDGSVREPHVNGNSAAPDQVWWQRIFFGTPLAMAASFLLAFLLGLALRGTLWPTGRGIGSTNEGDFVVEPSRPETKAGAQFVRDDRSPATSVGGSAAPRAEAPPRVRFVVNDVLSGTPSKIEVPVLENGSLEDLWRQSWPSPVPEEVVRELQRTGHRIERHRRMMPVRLEDGRRVVVPVEQIEVVPVGRRAYQ